MSPTVRNISPDLSACTGRYAVVYTQWNAYVVNSLLDGARETLLSHGIRAQDITTVQCPGAFEMPLVLKKLAATGRYDAIVALGAVIRGSTPHFEYVAGEAVKGISTVMMEYNLPVTFGILTVDTIEPAIERSGTKMGNKGAEAALAALEMVSLSGKIDRQNQQERPQ